ncbi:MAG: PepSY-associated TM helix domain-containing protein, partial [Planctomycetaceae bacterium]
MSRSSPGRSHDRLRHASRMLAAVSRWLHIYLSMVAFATMLLFSVTGLTLNHPDWFGAGEAVTEDATGGIDPALLGDPEADPDGLRIDHEAVAAAIRGSHRITGGLADRRADDRECTLTWKGPGCAADAVIDRRTGRYTLAVTRHGLVAILNDLHKGRDTGAAWSIVIDVTAILLVLVAISGFVLIFFIRRRRVAGLAASLVGTLL